MPILENVSNDEYHAHDSVSKSGLDLINISPREFLSNMPEPNENMSEMAKRIPEEYHIYMKGNRVETPAMKEGTLIHCAVLEPDELLNRYYAMDESVDRRTKAGKARWEEIQQEAEGRIIITNDQHHMAMRIRDEVSKHSIARLLFDGGDAETSIFSSINDADVRCRPDYKNGGVLADVKSTDNAGEGFEKSVAKYRYYVQHPFYVDIANNEGLEINNFIFVAIEKKEPFGIGIYQLDDCAIDYGRREYKADLDTFKRCLDTGIWPGYQETIKTLSLPRYAISRIENKVGD
ncbi:MAG: PD-(D/E)XK nuclease-like domain-containing protein [Methylobacter sp.]